MKREQQFVKNSIVLSIGTILPKFASIITLPIVTGYLTKSEYGTYDLITILVSFVLPIATLQMQSAAFRFLITARNESETQKTIITNITVFTIPICILTLMVLFFLFPEIEVSTRILIILYFFVDIILTTVRQISRGLALNLAYSISAIVNSFIEMLLVVVFIWALHYGLNGALLAMIIAQTCSLFYLSAKSHVLSYIDFRLVSKTQIKSMLSYSWPMIPNSLSSWIMRVSDRFILTWFMGVEANAIYAVANRLPNIFSIVQSTFSLAWQENASISVEDEDSAEYYGKMFDHIFRLLVGCMALLIAFTPIIFNILIRGDYEGAYNHMPILYLAMMFSTISSYLGGIYIAHMKSKEIGITTAIAAAFNFLINLCFVNLIGIYAASLSTLIGYMWLSIYRMRNIQKFQKIKFHYRRIVLLLLLLIVMAILCFMRIPMLDMLNMLTSVIVAFALNRILIMRLFHTLFLQVKKNIRKDS
mgnify:FL=1